MHWVNVVKSTLAACNHGLEVFLAVKDIKIFFPKGKIKYKVLQENVFKLSFSFS